MSNKIDLTYSLDIFPEVTKNKDSNDISLSTIKYIVIQMTTDRDLARHCHAESVYRDTNAKNVRYAHYVVDSKKVVKYMQSIDTPFTNEIFLTGNRQNVMAVEVLWNDIIETEKTLVRFLSDFMFKWDIPIGALRRRSDVVRDEYVYKSLYDFEDNWYGLVDSVAARISALYSQKGGNDAKIPHNTVNVLKIPNLLNFNKDIIPVIPPNSFYPPTRNDFKQDIVKYSSPGSGVNAEEVHKDEDYTEDNVIGGLINVFTGESIRNTDKIINGFEPIYPDLTMPPKGNPTLYATKVYQLDDGKVYKKHTVGDLVNKEAPYPVEQKVAELQAHRPKVKIEDGETSDLGAVNPWLIAISERTEKRLVQLENISSTLMRYFHRLSSRVSINCVYYGGQATYYKYRCIRCLDDDLIHDKQLVTMDQCLNCTRYEPIEGQIYDILDDDLHLNLSPILDDNQMARTNMEDFIDNVYTDKMRSEMPKKDFDFEDINTPPEDDLHEKWKQESEKEYFTMDWQETELDENVPDVNDYIYNPADIAERKYSILDEPRHNAISDIKKIDIRLLPDSYNVMGGEYSGIGGSMYAGDARVSIVQRAKDLFKMNKEGKAAYSMDLDKRGKEVRGIYYLDCSSFANDCYKTAGLPHAGGINTYEMNDYFIKKRKGKVVTDVKDAKPGDMALWDGHVAIYVGDEMIIDASTGRGDLTENFKHRRYDRVTGKKFYGFCRTEELIRADKFAGTGIASEAIMLVVKKYGDRVNDWKKCIKNMEKWDYKNVFVDECVKANVDPYIMLGLVTRETGGDPTVKGTPRNPYNGLFQVKNGDYSGTFGGIKSNIKQGIEHYKYMKKLTEKKFKIANANPMLTMYCYNSGPGNVYPWLQMSGLEKRANEASPIEVVEAIRENYPKKPIKGDVGGVVSRSMYGVMVLYYAEQFKSLNILRYS